MSAPDRLQFEPGVALLPIGFPSTGWETKSAAMRGDVYIVTANGRLIFKPIATNLTFRSNDASGVLSLFINDAVGLCLHKLSVRFHNGEVVDIGSGASNPDGFKWQPTWLLVETPFQADQTDVVEQLIAIIRVCNSGREYEFDNENIRLMVALALCRHDLLQSTAPAKAWQMLNIDQIKAMTTWWL